MAADAQRSYGFSLREPRDGHPPAGALESLTAVPATAAAAAAAAAADYCHAPRTRSSTQTDPSRHSLIAAFGMPMSGSALF